SLISWASWFSESMRRAVTTIFKFLGEVRANSFAVLLPIPAEAPVTTTVLPSRRFAIADAIVRLRMFGWTVRWNGFVRKDGESAERGLGDEVSWRRNPIDLVYTRRWFIKDFAEIGNPSGEGP